MGWSYTQSAMAVDVLTRSNHQISSRFKMAAYRSREPVKLTWVDRSLKAPLRRS